MTAFVLLSQSILRLSWLWSNGHCYEGLAPTVMYSTQKTLKHIPLTHTSSLSPRLVFNYTLFYFIMMSNKLSTLISTSILYYLLILLSYSPCYSSWSHLGLLFLLHPISQLSENPGSATFQRSPEPSTSHYLHCKHPGREPALFLTCFLISYSMVCSHSAARVTCQSLSQFIYFFP